MNENIEIVREHLEWVKDRLAAWKNISESDRQWFYLSLANHIEQALEFLAREENHFEQLEAALQAQLKDVKARNAALEAEHEAVTKHIRLGFKYSGCGCHNCEHLDCIDAWTKLDQAHQKVQGEPV